MPDPEHRLPIELKQPSMRDALAAGARSNSSSSAAASSTLPGSSLFNSWPSIDAKDETLVPKRRLSRGADKPFVPAILSGASSSAAAMSFRDLEQLSSAKPPRKPRHPYFDEEDTLQDEYDELGEADADMDADPDDGKAHDARFALALAEDEPLPDAKSSSGKRARRDSLVLSALSGTSSSSSSRSPRLASAPLVSAGTSAAVLEKARRIAAQQAESFGSAAIGTDRKRRPPISPLGAAETRAR